MGAEFLTRRTLAVKTLKHIVEFAGRNAWPGVLDRQGDLVGIGHQREGDDAADGRETDGIVDEVAQDLHQTILIAAHPGRLGALGGADHLSVMVQTGDAIDIAHRRRHRRQVDRREIGAAQFGVQPRGVGNVTDQPVDPLHIVKNNRHQLGPLPWVFDARRGLHRAAQRGKRVFNFMGDIGGEPFDGVDPVAQGFGHIAQGHRQIADFIAARGQVGNFAAPPPPGAHILGGPRQTLHRPDDGAGQIQRQQYGDGENNREHAKNFQSHVTHGGVDIGPLGRQHQGAQHFLIALHRHRDA